MAAESDPSMLSKAQSDGKSAAAVSSASDTRASSDGARGVAQRHGVTMASGIAPAAATTLRGPQRVAWCCNASA